MNILIIGLGIQGNKRKKILEKNKKNNVVTLDPYNSFSDYKKIEEINFNSVDCIFLCVPDKIKKKYINLCIKKKKSFLIEKPFPRYSQKETKKIIKKLRLNNIICYVAYNHRFEPHFIRAKKIINSKILSKIYTCKLFYGNGTARLVKNSRWRDVGSGVLNDLGSHLIDIIFFWFKPKINKILFANNNKFENKSSDHFQVIFKSNKILFTVEMTMCMWKNYFYCDILANKGSLHIKSLCKWSDSQLIHHKRIFPSGLPKEKTYCEKKGDPTWEKEHKFFFRSIKNNRSSDLIYNYKINNFLDKIFNLSKNK